MQRRLVVFVLGAILIIACETTRENESRLARQYCSSCHVFPEPGLLSKQTWANHVLPEMKFRMGFMNREKMLRFSQADREAISKVLPTHPMLSEADFQSIRNYYLRLAPDTLTLQTGAPLVESGTFRAEPQSLPGYPVLSLITIDTIHNHIYTGTRFGELLQYDFYFQQQDSLLLPGAPSHLIIQRNGITAVTMGIMDPNDQPAGHLIRFHSNEMKKEILLDSLQRPVYATSRDMNGDGSEDFVVAAFGNHTGALQVFESTGKTYRKHVVSTLPGTRKIIIGDFNVDGAPDILALIAQGDEQISLFLNKGSFQFEKKVLLRFPPVYGSSFFEVADLNQDGQFDIVYSNGDNADYSPGVKPYHGMHAYINRGNNQFEESFFYPIPGASQFRLHDFDKDGDADILVIAYFPDYRNAPEKSIVYLENKASSFVPHSVAGATLGRWITLDTGDIDHDGDIDAVIAALDFEAGVPPALIAKWNKAPVSVLVLRNTAR